jgi:hypothetical protein
MNEILPGSGRGRVRKTLSRVFLAVVILLLSKSSALAGDNPQVVGAIRRPGASRKPRHGHPAKGRLMGRGSWEKAT